VNVPNALSAVMDVIVSIRRWCMAHDLGASLRNSPLPEPSPMRYPKRTQYKYAKSLLPT
jgi:hypothetical protein